MICVDAYKIESYKYRVIECMAKIEKICSHVIPKYANYRENY